MASKTNTKVKGSAESSYRTGNVNLTPDNIGASRQFTISLTGNNLGLAYSTVADLQAPSVSGYTFFCWLGCATVGWVGSVYIEDLLASKTHIWNCARNYDGGTGWVNCWALFRKNS